MTILAQFVCHLVMLEGFQSFEWCQWPKFHLAWLYTTWHVRLCWAVLFNMADDEEAVVLACTSLVFCALSVHVNKTEKRRHAVWVKHYLKKRETLGCYNSLPMSDLMNHKAIWSNYMRIDIELFEELFNHAWYHIILVIILDHKLN